MSIQLVGSHRIPPETLSFRVGCCSGLTNNCNCDKDVPPQGPPGSLGPKSPNDPKTSVSNVGASSPPWSGLGRQGGMKDISEGSSTGAGVVGLVSTQPPVVEKGKGKGDENVYVNKNPIGLQPGEAIVEFYQVTDNRKAGKSAQSTLGSSGIAKRKGFGCVGAQECLVPGAVTQLSQGGEEGHTLAGQGKSKAVPRAQQVQNTGKMAPINPLKKGPGDSDVLQAALPAPLRPSYKGGKIIGGQPIQQQLTTNTGKSGSGWVPPLDPQVGRKASKNQPQ